MSSNRRTRVSKPQIDETELSLRERNTRASVSVPKADASVQHVKTHAARKIANQYPKEGVFYVSGAVEVASGRRKALVGKLQEKEYRDAYVKATITHGLAHQIRCNRELRKWTQTSLAEKCGAKTTQVTISRLEDPAYDKFTFNTILKVASALDVAVHVKLVPYSKFLLETADKSVVGLCAKSFSEENLFAKQALVTLTMVGNKPQAMPYVAIGSTSSQSADFPVVAKQSEILDSRQLGYL